MAKTRIRALAVSPNSIRKAKDSRIRAIVARANMEDKIKKYEMAEAMNITRQSLQNKLDRPETITLGELRGLRELIGITPEELDQVI